MHPAFEIRLAVRADVLAIDRGQRVTAGQDLLHRPLPCIDPAAGFRRPVILHRCQIDIGGRLSSTQLSVRRMPGSGWIAWLPQKFRPSMAGTGPFADSAHRPAGPSAVRACRRDRSRSGCALPCRRAPRLSRSKTSKTIFSGLPRRAAVHLAGEELQQLGPAFFPPLGGTGDARTITRDQRIGERLRMN